jgi:hypothetical protein
MQQLLSLGSMLGCWQITVQLLHALEQCFYLSYEHRFCTLLKLTYSYLADACVFSNFAHNL